MWAITRAALLSFPSVRREYNPLAEQVRGHISRLELADISLDPVLIRAVVAAEDRRFWSHAGFDPLAAVRAVFFFCVRKKISGASTIEQQLVRTLRNRYEVTLQRKVSEIALALLVACEFSKKQIVEIYLYSAYFGWRATGVEMAACRLGVSLSNLSVREAATIAAMLKLPMPRLPSDRYAERIAARIEYVLAAMESGALKSSG